VNRRPYASALLLVLFAAAALLATGCRKKQEPVVTPEPPPVEKPPALPQEEVKPPPLAEPPEPEPPVEVVDIDAIMRDQNTNRSYLKTVYFDFDKYDLRPDTIATLKSNAGWIKENTQFKIVVEGHCDERGTIEYNLELGSKRARAVIDYLASLGVSRSRMRPVSYGEERPVDLGHDETAWAKNRRGDFTLEK
jgi:peptidoglycan-associated lipoprotein